MNRKLIIALIAIVAIIGIGLFAFTNTNSSSSSLNLDYNALEDGGNLVVDSESLDKSNIITTRILQKLMAF